MKRIFPLFLIILVLAVSGCTATGDAANGENKAGKITVFKTAYCGCCAGYANELGKKGFDVETVTVQDIAEIKEKYGIPGSMQSCHTAVVDGYFVEGHVPIEAVQKLLEEKPDIDGIALPGMPSGSPGMGGRKTGSFEVHAVDGSESKGIFLAV